MLQQLGIFGLAIFGLYFVFSYFSKKSEKLKEYESLFEFSDKCKEFEKKFKENHEEMNLILERDLKIGKFEILKNSKERKAAIQNKKAWEGSQQNQPA